jgi:hypothetical protein
MDTRTRLTLPSIHPRSALTSNRRHLARRVKPRTLDHAPCEKMCVRYFGRFIALLADAHRTPVLRVSFRTAPRLRMRVSRRERCRRD